MSVRSFKCCKECNHPPNCKSCPGSKEPELDERAFVTGPNMTIGNTDLFVEHIRALVNHINAVSAHHQSSGTSGGTFTATGEPPTCSTSRSQAKIFAATPDGALRILKQTILLVGQHNFKYSIEKIDGVYTVVRK